LKFAITGRMMTAPKSFTACGGRCPARANGRTDFGIRTRATDSAIRRATGYGSRG